MAYTDWHIREIWSAYGRAVRDSAALLPPTSTLDAFLRLTSVARLALQAERHPTGDLEQLRLEMTPYRARASRSMPPGGRW